MPANKMKSRTISTGRPRSMIAVNSQRTASPAYSQTGHGDGGPGRRSMTIYPRMVVAACRSTALQGDEIGCGALPDLTADADFAEAAQVKAARFAAEFGKSSERQWQKTRPGWWASDLRAAREGWAQLPDR